MKLSYSKDRYVKALRAAGIRKAIKDQTGEFVPLQHLKTAQLVRMYYEYCS